MYYCKCKCGKSNHNNVNSFSSTYWEERGCCDIVYIFCGSYENCYIINYDNKKYSFDNNSGNFFHDNYQKRIKTEITINKDLSLEEVEKILTNLIKNLCFA